MLDQKKLKEEERWEVREEEDVKYQKKEIKGSLSKEHEQERGKETPAIPDIHIFCSPFLLWVLDLLLCF